MIIRYYTRWHQRKWWTPLCQCYITVIATCYNILNCRAKLTWSIFSSLPTKHTLPQKLWRCADARGQCCQQRFGRPASSCSSAWLRWRQWETTLIGWAYTWAGWWDWICLTTTHVLQDILAVLHTSKCVSDLLSFSKQITQVRSYYLGASWS